MSRFQYTNRNLELLEPYEWKRSRTVLRGESGSNVADLPDRPSDLNQRDGRAIRKGNEIAKLYADNKVDVLIYAVEKSLDSYKFNLLQNKQLFINQLKTNNMATRTIDEGSLDEGSMFKDNRFFIEGEGNIKYSYNNGHIATDPILASKNFLNALEKIPNLIDKYQSDSKKLEKDVPVLKEVISSVFKKEPELKDLKSQLDSLSRQINLSLENKENKKEDILPDNKSNNQQIDISMHKKRVFSMR